MQIEDSMSAQRNEELCGLMAKSMKDNMGFYMETDMLSSFFLKMLGRSEPFRAYFVKH